MRMLKETPKVFVCLGKWSKQADACTSDHRSHQSGSGKFMNYIDSTEKD